MNSENRVLFIAEGSPSIGFGHISRCITIAEEFKDKGFEAFFLFKEGGYFRKEVEEKFQILDVIDFGIEHYFDFQELIKTNKIGTVVIDLVEEEYLKLSWLRQKFNFLKIVSITLFLFPFEKRYEDLSFFPDIEFKSDEKKDSKYGEFYLIAGPEYLVFRKEFRDLEKNVRNNANKVLITMGGTDPQGISLKVIMALKECSNLRITLVLSKLSPFYDVISSEISTECKAKINIIEKSEKISELMQEHDVILLNGGLTRYEACLTKTPFIAISIHKIQFRITEKLTKLGVGINLGVFDELNKKEIADAVNSLLENYYLRRRISENMKGIFDGLGASRIFRRIVDYKN